MRKIKLALGLSGQFGIPVERQIEMFRNVGFDGFFFGWSDNTDVSSIVKCAEKYGMAIGSAMRRSCGATDFGKSRTRLNLRLMN